MIRHTIMERCTRPAHRRRSGILPWGSAAFGLAVHSLVGGIALASAVAADFRIGNGMMGARLRCVHRNTRPQAGRCPHDHGTHAPSWRAATTHASHQPRFFSDDPGRRRPVLDWDSRAPRLSPGAWTSGALAFSAGTFLCIALSDLLPELQFHSHDRLKLSIALLAGFALMAVTAGLEPDSHPERGAAHPLSPVCHALNRSPHPDRLSRRNATQIPSGSDQDTRPPLWTTVRSASGRGLASETHPRPGD